MSDKKDRILDAALQLFATEGYNSVATSRIARQAGVSEGLIFRHFGNKKGLLDALVQGAEAELGQVFSEVMTETDPRQVIQRTLGIPLGIDPQDYNFWKLQFKLKWEDDYNNPDKSQPILRKLEDAFRTLGYEQPAFEALRVYHILDAMSIAILRDQQTIDPDYIAFLRKQYDQ